MRVRTAKAWGAGAAVGVLLLAGGTGTAQAACPDEDLSWRSGELERLRAAVVCLVNEERGARGIPGVVLEPRLTLAAQRHSDDMAHRGYMDHRTPPGAEPFPHGATLCARLQHAGYDDCQGVAEDLGATETPLTEVRGNLEDAGHCSPMMQGAAREIGVGVAGGKWTLDFGARRAEFTSTMCPDKLAREGGAQPVPSVEPFRPTIGRTAVTLPLKCHRGGGPCNLTWWVRRAGRVEVKRTLRLAVGQSHRLVIRPGKASLRRLARTGRVTFNFRMRAELIDELVQDRDFTLRR